MKQFFMIFLTGFAVSLPLHSAACQVKEIFGVPNSLQEHNAMYRMDSLVAIRLYPQKNELNRFWRGFYPIGSDLEHEATFPFHISEQFVKSRESNNDKLKQSMGYGTQVYLPDTVVVHGMNVPVLHAYSYDANGRMISELIEKWQNSQWIDSLLHTWTYGADGREYTQLDQVWQDSQWVKNTFESYTYDANGNMITQLNENWQNNQWVNSTRWTYTYNSDGNALTLLLDYWQDSLWVKEYGEKYTYDAAGNMLTTSHELYDSTQTIYYSWQADFTYGANENLLTETDHETLSPYPGVCTTEYIYKYDSSGHVLTTLLTDFCDYDTVRTNYTYDARGNQTSESEWDGREPYLTLLRHDTTVYNYDSSGNLVLLVHKTLQNPFSDAMYGGMSFNRVGNFYDFSGDTISLTWDQLQVPPVGVTLFAAQSSLDSVALTWNTLYEEGNRGFNLLRKVPAADGFSIIASSLSGKTPNVPGINEAGKRYSFVDSKLEGAGTYLYGLEAVNTDGSTNDLNTIQVVVQAPEVFALYQNYPNPFNPSTTITFDLDQAADVSLDIYNVLGQKVEGWRYGVMIPGRYSEVINMGRYASGIYFYRLVAGDFVKTKKLVLVK